jgi:hypothetical protein
MENLHYLFIGLLILMFIGLFGNMPRNKNMQQDQTQPQQPTSTSNTVIIANGQPAPKKYGYVPPPAYNPYKRQYYN